MTQRERVEYWKGKVGQRVRFKSPDRGVYTIGDQEFLRVSTCLNGLPKEKLVPWAARCSAEYAIENWEYLSGLPKEDAFKLIRDARFKVSDKAKERGNVIHKAAESLCGGTGELPDKLTEEEMECAIQVEAFLREYASKPMEIEQTVFSPRFGYAGTFDRWAIGPDNRRWLFDYKSNKKGIFVESGLQLSAYQHAEYALVEKTPKGRNSWEGTVIKWGPQQAEELCVVHVRPDGCTPHIVMDSPYLWTVFRASKHNAEFLLAADPPNYGKSTRDVYRVLDDVRAETINAAA